eukprot:GHVN01094455.1.p2 GENE.GHVN01094455.1~~GHVN01094455.1.p2  ORF type:complete len:502 (+),score=120.71 GHVN01094455.1:160-1506(+)
MQSECRVPLAEEVCDDVVKSRDDSASLFDAYRYDNLIRSLNRGSGRGPPSWVSPSSVAWSEEGRRWRKHVGERSEVEEMRYGAIVFPHYIPLERHMRSQLAARHTAEFEMAKNSRRTATVGGGPPRRTDDVGKLMKDNTVSAQLDELGVSGGNKSETTKYELQQTLQEKRLSMMKSMLPAFDEAATDPELIYQAADVFPRRLSDDPAYPYGLTRQYLVDASSVPSDLARDRAWTHCGRDLLAKARHRCVTMTGSAIDEAAKRITLVNILIRLYKAKSTKRVANEREMAKLLSSPTLGRLPQTMVLWVCARFTVKGTGTGTDAEAYVSHQLECKLLTTIMWLCVALTGDWCYDFTPLVELDLMKKDGTKVGEWGRLMGLRKVKGNKANVFELKGPILTDDDALGRAYLDANTAVGALLRDERGKSSKLRDQKRKDDKRLVDESKEVHDE